MLEQYAKTLWFSQKVLRVLQQYPQQNGLISKANAASLAVLSASLIIFSSVSLKYSDVIEDIMDSFETVVTASQVLKQILGVNIYIFI